MPLADRARDGAARAASRRGGARRDGSRRRPALSGEGEGEGAAAGARAARRATGDEVEPGASRTRFAAIGFLGGLLGSLLGVGGGFVMVPLQMAWAKLGPHIANGTSLAIIAPIALVALPIYALVGGGQVDFRLALPLAVGAVVGAYAGARFVARIPEPILRRIVAAVLLVAGLKQLVFPG